MAEIVTINDIPSGSGVGTTDIPHDYITLFNEGAGKDGQSTLRFNFVTNLHVSGERLLFNYKSASATDKVMIGNFAKGVNISYPEV